jgi:hypothetical protein
MFKRRTLFVLGAGASFEANLPVGLGLAKMIVKKLDVRVGDHGRNIGEGDGALLQQFKDQFPADFNGYLQAGWRIRDGLPTASSIDDFLDMHSHDELMQLAGKAAIVKTILEAERESHLFFDPNNSRDRSIVLGKLEASWFMRFLRVLGRNVAKANVRQIFDNVGFVVFNYDRCLEFFLLNALQAMYSISINEAVSIVQNLTIVHPYGTVGNLPDFGNGNQIPFGGGDQHFDYNTITLAKRIKTYTEQIGGSEQTNAIRNEVIRADQIVFLGFAYHEQNMLLLRPPEELGHAIPIYGTAVGMSNSDVAIAIGELSSWFLPEAVEGSDLIESIHIENKLTCAALFDNYAKSFTSGN